MFIAMRFTLIATALNTMLVAMSPWDDRQYAALMAAWREIK